MTNELILITDTSDPTFQRSIGAYQVAHHARSHGITAQVIDFASMFDPKELAEIIIKCVTKDTLAIGVSTTFINFDTQTISDPEERMYKTVSRPNLYKPRRHDTLPTHMSEALHVIKEKYPDIKIIVGGSNSYRIKDNELVDVVFHGYSESSVIEYLMGLKTGRKKIYPKENGIAIVDGASDHFDIENLAHMWHENDCILPKEALPIEISRGCIFKCKFCSYPLIGKKKFDYLRDPERIRDELIRNYELYGTTNYFFADDTFNDSTYKVQRLHEMITKLPFKIKFVAYIRVDLLHAHPEQIPMLYEMGLGHAFMGIETLNPATAKIIGKGMNPDKFKKFILDLYYNHWKEEILLTCSFIIGLPKESEESVRATFDWVNNTPLISNFFSLNLKEGGHFESEFDINYEKYGYTKHKVAKTEDGFEQAIDAWSNEHMTSERAEEISMEFNTIRYVNPGVSRLNAFKMFAMTNHGYTFEQLRNTPAKEFTPMSVLRKKVKLFNIYKAMLLAVIAKNSEPSENVTESALLAEV